MLPCGAGKTFWNCAHFTLVLSGKATICIELGTIWLSQKLCLQVDHMDVLDMEGEQIQGVAYYRAVQKSLLGL